MVGEGARVGIAGAVEYAPSSVSSASATSAHAYADDQLGCADGAGAAPPKRDINPFTAVEKSGSSSTL